MTSLEAALRKIADELTGAGVPFALVGGLAVSVRTEPRFTRDADLVVAVATDAEAEALVHSSNEPQAPVVDLLFASSGIESEVAAEAEPIELLPHLTMGVARIGHLIALKVLSRDDVKRPQDLVDLRGLLRVASPAELTRARQSLALISARGYHRGRDLASEIDALAPPEH